MTPRLWEDVLLELQKQANLKDNVIFSAQGASKKSFGTVYHVKSKNNLGLLSSPFEIFGFFWPEKCIFRNCTPKMMEGPKMYFFD